MKLRHYIKIFNFNLLLFFFLFTVVFIVRIQAQSNNSIGGFIFSVDRSPLSEIQVELLDEYNRMVSRTKTEGSGRYNFFRLAQGRYYIHVLPLGTNYEEQTKDVEIVNITRQSSATGAIISSGWENKQQDFYLRTTQNANNSSTITGVVFAQEVPKPAQRYYEKAVSDLKEKKIDESLKELKSAIEIFPEYYLALETLGQEYINQQKYSEARDILSKAVEVNPRSFECSYALGFSLYKLKNYTEAIEALKKSVEINNSSVNSLFLLGVNLKQIGKYEEAVDNLKKAQKLATVPKSEIHWQLALIYTNNLKKYSAAADELELFLKINPNYEEAEKVKVLIKTLRAKAKT
jgi:tetratricopeptide (TPR) repeat protein